MQEGAVLPSVPRFVPPSPRTTPTASAGCPTWARAYGTELRTKCGWERPRAFGPADGVAPTHTCMASSGCHTPWPRGQARRCPTTSRLLSQTILHRRSSSGAERFGNPLVPPLVPPTEDQSTNARATLRRFEAVRCNDPGHRATPPPYRGGRSVPMYSYRRSAGKDAA
jgi:hypothetical protein